jgi:hypothetical protein
LRFNGSRAFGLIDEIDGGMLDDGEVMRCVILADTALVFAECDVEDPVVVSVNTGLGKLNALGIEASSRDV